MSNIKYIKNLALANLARHGQKGAMALLLSLSLGGTASAWDNNISTKVESGFTYDGGNPKYQKAIGNYVITMDRWAWNLVGTGAWMHQHYNNSDLKDWALSYDVTQSNPNWLKAWPNVRMTRKGGMPKKLNGSLPSKVSFTANITSQSYHNYNLMIDTWGNEGTDTAVSETFGFECMICLDKDVPTWATSNTINGALWYHWGYWDGSKRRYMFVRANKTNSVSNLTLQPFYDKATIYKRQDGTSRILWLTQIGCGVEPWTGKASWRMSNTTITP